MKRFVGKFRTYTVVVVALMLLLASLPAMANSQSVTLDRGNRPGAGDRASDDSKPNTDSSSTPPSNNNNGPQRPDRFSRTDDFSPLNNNSTDKNTPTYTIQQNSTAQAPTDVPQVPEPATLLLTGSAMLLIARKLRK